MSCFAYEATYAVNESDYQLMEDIFKECMKPCKYCKQAPSVIVDCLNENQK